MWKKKICGIISVVFISVFLLGAVSLQVSAEKTNTTLGDSADNYVDIVEKESGGDVIYNIYYDFDGDGTHEMFALVQKDSSDSLWNKEKDVIGGRLWYVNADGPIEVMSQPKPYYKDPKVLEFDGRAILPLNEAFATGTRTYLWGVLGGKPYELNASGQINGLSINEYGEIEGTGEDYNETWSKEDNSLTGHTRNTYYFYFEHGNFREYGGKEISWEEFCRIPGIEAAKKKIEEEMFRQGEEIDTIYYRKNGIVAVNFTREEEFSVNYSNIQFRITKDGVKICATTNDSGFSSGTISRAFLDELATYPETFPY